MVSVGIILSQEDNRQDVEEKTNQQYNILNNRTDVSSPPYEKSKDSTVQVDEELPPYSVLAPDIHVKRRRKHGSGEIQLFQMPDITEDEAKKRDDWNRQMPTNGDCVWLHNVSQVPVFVTSPTLEPIPYESMKTSQHTSSNVRKVSPQKETPGDCLHNRPFNSGKK